MSKRASRWYSARASVLSARVRSLLRLKRYTDELDSAEAVIVSLALTIEARVRDR
jgi:hypothetical protein